MSRNQAIGKRRAGGGRGALGCLLGLAMAASLCSCDQPVKPAGQAQLMPIGQWATLFDGKTLKGWKAPEWGGSGKVYVKDGAIHMEMGATCTGATYTGAVPREDYEVQLEAQRVDGGDFFCGLTFPVGKDSMTLVLGGWGGMVTGLSCINGRDASENETTQGIEYTKGRWYPIRVRVTKAKISAWVDGNQIADVERKGKEIGIRWEVEESVPLGIATWQTHGAARDIQIRRIDSTDG